MLRPRRNMRHVLSALRAAMIPIGISGCAAIAGIDEAKIDPRLNRETAGSGGGTTTSTVEAKGADALCREYCDLMQESCGNPSSGYQQFESDGVCMAFCARLPPGNEGDTLVNSVWCRVKQARLAKTAGSDAEPNCQAAGPGSDGITCGPKCATYCRMMREVCATDFGTNYSDDAACLDECLSLPEAGPYDAKPAHDGQKKDVNCRLYHLTAASVPELTSTHCPHPIGPKSTCTR